MGDSVFLRQEFTLRTFLKILKRTLLVLLLLLVMAWIAIHIPFVQNWIIQKVTKNLSESLHTRVSIKHIDFSPFNKMEMEGLLVEDRKQDTLLYAGIAKVNITDWFFLRDKATLKYAGLEDARVNMYRTDSVWNYQFLVDYFGGSKKSGSSKKGLELDLKKLDLKNIQISRRDGWIGEDMLASLKSLQLDAEQIDFNKKQILLNGIRLNEPVFALRNYTGNRPFSAKPSTPVATPVEALQTMALQWNKAGWEITVREIALNNGSFRNDKATDRLPYTDHFDGLHLEFTGITGTLKNVHLFNDTITTDLELKAREKSGLEIKQLQTTAKVTPAVMEFSRLNLVTNKSRIGNYFAMHYNNFNEDMNNFLHNVVLEGNFENTQFDSDDLAIFAPATGAWNRVFSINGYAKGAVDNLSAKKMLIRSGNTIVDGDIALRGLPDINTTFIDFKSNDLQTNYRDLVILVPQLRRVTQPNLRQLGNIRFKGNFTGFINDFVAFGNINTSLGNLNADLNMKLPEGRQPTYSGHISSAGFNLGVFVNSNKLGTIALNGTVKGSGFKLKDLDANFDGTIQRIYFSGYTYQAITVKGTFKKNQFQGTFSSNDPNLKVVNGTGTIQLAGKDTHFDFDAQLDKANLQALQLTRDNFTVSGHFNLKFTGDNIDNFLGTARVYNATLFHDSTRLSFDSLSISSAMLDSAKVLSIQSNEVDASLTGRFRIMELPDAFKLFLNRYYPSYITRPENTLSDQDFSFLIKTRLVDEYVQLVDKKLKGFNFSTFSGNLKLAQNELNINADIPEFEYDGKVFNNVSLQSTGNLNALSARITTGDIGITDSLHFPGTELNITAQNDISNISLKTSAGKTLSEAELNATVKTLSDGVIIHFSPSSFIINDKKWKLEKDGELTIRKNFISASEVKFTQDEQEIVISTEPDKETGGTDVVARLRKVHADDFIAPFLKEPRLEGIVSGTLRMKDPFGKQKIEFKGKAENFVYENKKVGDVDLTADVDTETGMINFNAHANDPKNKFDINGHYNYKSEAEDKLDVDFISEHFNISLLDAYLGSVFSNIEGDAESTLKVKWLGDRKTITGSVTVSEGSFIVNYTRCKYRFDRETILFNPDEIDLGTIQLKDTLNHTGTASGKLYHNFFNDFVFDNVHFETPKMLLLNTTRRDNSQFYGKVTGNATLNVDGPLTNLRMDIAGKPSPLAADSSHIYLLTGSSKEAGAIDYIEFIQFGSKMEDELKGKKGTNILVNMNITATDACKVDVILDESLGDVIKGSGQGELNIRVGTQEPLSIRGTYAIKRGEYTFNFQTWIKKFFTITDGSSITWNGDPENALININAEYTAPKVDFSTIASNGFKQRDDLLIIAHLTGVLKNPEINFEFVLPPKSPINSDYVAVRKLESFRTDKNNMLKQVASLLLVNTFISENQNFLSGSSAVTTTVNTIGGAVSSWLTGLFNKELEKATKGILTTYLDINSSLDLQNKAALLQANVNAGLKILLNNRLVILIGGNLDYNNPYAQLGNRSIVTPDITIEYTLTKDGAWKAIGFNRTSIVATDLTGVQRNRSGLKITYHKDFDIPTKEERRKKREERKKKKNKE